MNKRDAALKNWVIFELILTIIGVGWCVYLFMNLQGPTPVPTGVALTFIVAGIVLFGRGNILYVLMQTLKTKEQQLIEQDKKIEDPDKWFDADEDK